MPRTACAVAIQHNGQEIWHRDIGPDDYALYTPTLSSRVVKKGDRIYFRVQSRFDGAYDNVAWAPAISYLAVLSTERDVNDLNPYYYSAADDFVYAGRPVIQNLPYRGKVRISGDLLKKGETTDDIEVAVYIMTDEQLENIQYITDIPRLITPVISRVMAWNEKGTLTLAEGEYDFAVGQGDNLFVLVRVDSNIDLSQIEWKPKVFYLEAYAPDAAAKDEDGNPARDEDGNPVGHEPGAPLPVTNDKGEYTIQVNPIYDIEFYPGNKLTAPQQPYTVEKTGYLFLTPRVTGTPAAAGASADMVFTIKRRSELVQKRVINMQNGEFTEPYLATTALSVQQGDELYFDFTSRSTEPEKLFESVQATLAYGTTSSWRSFLTGTARFKPSLSFNFSDPETAPSGTILMVVRRNAEVVERHIINVDSGSIFDPSLPVLDLPVTAGDELYFDFITNSKELKDGLISSSVSMTYDPNYSWTAPKTGDVVVTPGLGFSFGGNTPDGQITFTVRKNGAVAGQRVFSVQKGTVIQPDPLEVPVQVEKGSVLKFEYSTADAALAQYLNTFSAEVSYADNGAPETVQASIIVKGIPHAFTLEAKESAALHHNLASNAFPRPYRGWGGIGYNGNKSCTQKKAGDPCTEPPIDEKLLAISTSETRRYLCPRLKPWKTAGSARTTSGGSRRAP